MLVMRAPILRATVGGPMRLLVITARYPIPEQPAAGIFVQRRLADPAPPRHRGGAVHPPLTVVAALWRPALARPDGARPLRRGRGPLRAPVRRGRALRGAPSPPAARRRRTRVGRGGHRRSASGPRLAGAAGRSRERISWSPTRSTRAPRVERLGAEAIVIHPGIELGAFTVAAAARGTSGPLSRRRGNRQGLRHRARARRHPARTRPRGRGAEPDSGAPRRARRAARPLAGGGIRDRRRRGDRRRPLGGGCRRRVACARS